MLHVTRLAGNIQAEPANAQCWQTASQKAQRINSRPMLGVKVLKASQGKAVLNLASHQPAACSKASSTIMNILLILLILLLLGGGGYGFKSGNHYLGGGASLLVIILIILLLTGRI